MKITTYLFALLSTAFVAGCGGDDDPVDIPSTSGGAALPITQVAEVQGFDALLAAADKAGLVSALAAPDAQLTVFAPSDTAFNNLATTLGFADAAAMVSALPAETLADILRYHVLPTELPAQQLSAVAPGQQPTLYQFEGQPAALSVSADGGVTVTDALLTSASVTRADVDASNGVIHAVDKVLVPPGVLDIVQMARLNPEFSALVDAVASAGLADALAGSGPFTVFAPTNAAFSAAPAGLTADQLSTVLQYHALGSEVLSSEIPFGTPVATLADQSITINAGTPPTISDTTDDPAAVVATDVQASNGVIHVIDKVLIPAL